MTTQPLDAESPRTTEFEPQKSSDEKVEELKKTITVDTLHNDEAVKVLANYQGELEWTEPEEKKLIKKIDRRLLSIVVTTYGLQYYDKAMLSQAVCTHPLFQALQWRLSIVADSAFPGALRPAHRS